MFKIYSKGCEYAFRALAQLPVTTNGNIFSAKELFDKAGVSESFARKVFQVLVHKGILKAVPGPGGGYAFARDPRQVTLLDLVKAVDGDNVLDGCIMGLPKCNDKRPCPMHRSWKKVKGMLIKELDQKAVAHLMKK